MQTNDIYNTCLDISNVLNAGDISNARSKELHYFMRLMVLTIIHIWN